MCFLLDKAHLLVCRVARGGLPGDASLLLTKVSHGEPSGTRRKSVDVGTLVTSCVMRKNLTRNDRFSTGRDGRPPVDDLPRPFRLDLNASFQSAALAVERSARAIELAVEHGWADEPVVAVPTRPAA